MGEENPVAASPAAEVKPVAPKEEREELSAFEEKSSFSLAIFLNWLTAAVAILAAVFFWLLQKDISNKIVSLEDEKTSLVSQISSPLYKDVQVQATLFRSAVTELKKAQQERYPYSDFLTFLYQKINKDVKLNSIAVSADGRISIDGRTSSYKSAAQQLLVLEEWKANESNVLEAVNLSSISENINKDGSAEVIFAITASIDKNVSLVTETETPAATESSDSTIEEPPVSGEGE